LKICTKCGLNKPLSDFYTSPKSNKNKNGRRAACKLCWQELNHDGHETYKVDRLVRQNARWDRDRDRLNADARIYGKRSRAANPAKHAAKTKAAKCKREFRSAAWANVSHMALFYEVAQLLKEITGERQSVDHIIPLQGDNISGLHVENNLLVMSLVDNISKGKKIDLCGEWV